MDNALQTVSRADLVNLEGAIELLGNDKDEMNAAGLSHFFAPGCYARELVMPAGSVVVGKIHKHAHLNVLIAGKVTVSTEFGRETFTAPRIWTSEPGTKRSVYNHTEVRWLTIHPTDETDVPKIEESLIAPSFEAYDAFLEDQREKPVLLEQEVV